MSTPYRTRDLSRLSLSDLRAFVGARWSRRLAHNTYVEQLPHADLAIRLHATRILTFHSDGSFTVNSGGYRTVTTKQRLNALLPAGYRVYSLRYVWHISTPEGTFPFCDGDRYGAPQHDRINGHYGGTGCGCPIPTCSFLHAPWLWCGTGCVNSAPDGSFETADEKRTRLFGCTCSCHPFQARHGSASSPCTGCGCRTVGYVEVGERGVEIHLQPAAGEELAS